MRKPNCIILPEHKAPTSLRNLPKLDLKNSADNSSGDYGFKKENSTNRRVGDEYRWIFHGATKPTGETVDHWRLSVKPLKSFESFPNEWLGEIKSLKMRVGQLKQDIYSFHRNKVNNNNNNSSFTGNSG